MKIRRKTWGVGVGLIAAAAACSPELRDLGDEPVMRAGASSGGDGANGGTHQVGQAGSGTVLPNGGSGGKPVRPGAAGSPTNSAGAPEPGDCFSPTQRLDLLKVEGAVGCECQGEELTCVGSSEPDVAWFGALECVDGRWIRSPTGCDQDCFSPTNQPWRALDSDGVGCACDDAPPECVRTTYQGRPWDVAFQCVDGRWASVEDGACSWTAPGCRIDGVSYPSGARRVPTPFDACNTCDCKDGKLVDCTTLECAEFMCPDFSVPARRCLGCGPADDCSEYEIGCLSGEGCEDGLCSSPFCG